MTGWMKMTLFYSTETRRRTCSRQKKRDILKHLLFQYDDGSKNVFFCLAVNMMELGDLEKIVNQTDESFQNMSMIEKSKAVEEMICDTADKNGVLLELRPW